MWPVESSSAYHVRASRTLVSGSHDVCCVVYMCRMLTALSIAGGTPDGPRQSILASSGIFLEWGGLKRWPNYLETMYRVPAEPCVSLVEAIPLTSRPIQTAPPSRPKQAQGSDRWAVAFRDDRSAPLTA